MSSELLRFALSLASLALVALVGALFRVLRFSSTIRRELVSDGQYLEQLPTLAQARLREDMGNRANLLTAYSQCPVVTRTEFVAAVLAVVLGVGPVVAFYLIESTTPAAQRTTYDFVEPFFFYNVLQYTMIWPSLRTWGDRATRRLTLIDERLPDEVALEQKASFRLTLLGTRGVAILLFLGPIITEVVLAVSLAPTKSHLPTREVTAYVTIFVVTLIMVWGIWRAPRSSTLTKLLRPVPPLTGHFGFFGPPPRPHSADDP